MENWVEPQQFLKIFNEFYPNIHKNYLLIRQYDIFPYARTPDARIFRLFRSRTIRARTPAHLARVGDPHILTCLHLPSLGRWTPAIRLEV